MEYTREYWQPRIATNPNRFRKFNDSTDYVELINEPEAITQAGTAFAASRLNNMESGITGAVAGVNEIQGVLDFTTAVNTFSGLSQTSRRWYGMTTLGSDVYACVAFDYIYKQTGGVGDFIALEQTPRLWYGMTTLGDDVYASVYEGDIYKQTNGIGGFVALGQTPRLWHGMTTQGTDVYACVEGGDIYKQTNGTGGFVALGKTPRLWHGMTTLGSDVYACVYNGDIYKQTNGTGDFIALEQTPRLWYGMTTLGDDVYACEYTGDIYKQTNGAGDFIALGQTPRNWSGMTTLGNDVYACEYTGDIYTATILTGNTFRASSSFTLPAMPDGARKRILNTHATTAITVTAYSGTTIEGQATMTLSAGHEVELELIVTDWKKTGWNENALVSFVVSVDCSSRVAEYTGDGGGATVKDRAGNGKNLTATAITYVNGKYGKEMSFNGSTSFAQESSSVIGTTGTVAVRFKVGAAGVINPIFDNKRENYGSYLVRDASNALQYIQGVGVSGVQTKNIATFTDSDYHTMIIAYGSGETKYWFDGASIASSAYSTNTSQAGNLVLGAFTTKSSVLNGTISHFRYDSRIWTADEARAWSLNPISIDSRV